MAGISRRNFLRGTGAAAASAAAGKIPLPVAGTSVPVPELLKDPRALAAFEREIPIVAINGSVAPDWSDFEWGQLPLDRIRELQKQLKVADFFAKRQKPQDEARWNPVTRGFHTKQTTKITPTEYGEIRKQEWLAKGVPSTAPDPTDWVDLEARRYYNQDSVDNGIIDVIDDEWSKWQKDVIRANEGTPDARRAREELVKSGARLGSGRNEGDLIRQLTPMLNRGDVTAPADGPTRGGRFPSRQELGPLAAAAPLAVRPDFGMAPSPSMERMIPVTGTDAPEPTTPLEKFGAAIDTELDRPTLTRLTMDAVAPVRRQNDEVFTPRQVLTKLAYRQAVTAIMEGRDFDIQQSVADAVNLMKGRAVLGDPEAAASLRDDLIATVQGQAPQGDTAVDTGVSQEEFEGLAAKYGANANFMVPSSSQGNFEALRQAELFKTMTPQFEPATLGGVIASGVGQWFDDTPESAYQFMEGGMSMLGGDEDAKSARAMTAMRWYEKSMPEVDGYTMYRDPETNDAIFRRFSTITPTGLFGAVGGTDADRVYGRMNNVTGLYTSDSQATPEQRQYLQEARNVSNRAVPIIPTGMQPADISDALKYTNNQRAARDSMRSAMIAAQTGVYPSGFVDTMLNFDRYMGEPATLADFALTGSAASMGRRALVPAIKNMTGAMARQVGEEIATEPAFSLGIQGAAGGNMKDFFVGNPQQAYNALMQTETDGTPIENPIQPSDPRFQAEYEGRLLEEQNELERRRKEWEKKRQRPVSFSGNNNPVQSWGAAPPMTGQ